MTKKQEKKKVFVLKLGIFTACEMTMTKKKKKVFRLRIRHFSLEITYSLSYS